MSLSETSWEIVVLNISGKPQKLTCDSVQCCFRLVLKIMTYCCKSRKKRQKQLSEVFCEKRFSWKFRKIRRKTPAPESLF